VRHRDHTGRGKFSIIPPLLTARHLASWAPADIAHSEQWQGYSSCAEDPDITKDLREPPFRRRSSCCTRSLSTSVTLSIYTKFCSTCV
jgi:hypothetical protein